MSYQFRRADVHQEEDTIPWGRVAYAFFLVIVLSLALIACAFSLMKAREAELHPSGIPLEKGLAQSAEISRVERELFEEEGAGKGQAQRDAARKALTRYGWVDRERGLVSIPIDEAMELVIEESRP